MLLNCATYENEENVQDMTVDDDKIRCIGNIYTCEKMFFSFSTLQLIFIVKISQFILLFLNLTLTLFLNPSGFAIMLQFLTD